MWFDDSNKKQFIKISEKQFNQRYQIIQSLGKGNYGEVLKARSVHGNFVAIKSFKSQAIQQFHMIIREISNLKKLDHPNILKFYDCYIVDDVKYYMVTEYCPGGSLPDFIAQIPQERSKLALCQQMAEGIAYAHAHGIVHRDLKPENILIGHRNVAKIGDFGCSTRLQEKSEVLTSRVGSPAYMDYRVGRKQQYDHTADLYSLGMVFLWVFEGKGIYDECKSITDLNHHQSQISRDYENSIEEYIERLPTPIDAIVKNCLSPDYRNRFSAQIIAKMIAARLSQEKSSTNLISTQDDPEESLDNERVTFASRLMLLTKDFDRRYRNEKTRDLLFQLLRHNKQTLEDIKNIQGLRYVDGDTKAQFTFIVLLYYIYWVQQIRLIIRGEPSQLAKRYPQLEARSIEPDVQAMAEKHIEQERERVSSALLKCAERIQGTLHLLTQKSFLPIHFKQFVRSANQRQPLPFSLYKEMELFNSISEFFLKRVKTDYDYSRGDGEHDDRLKVIESIAKSFH